MGKKGQFIFFIHLRYAAMLKSRHVHGMNAGKLIITGLHNCTGAEVVKFSSIKTEHDLQTGHLPPASRSSPSPPLQTCWGSSSGWRCPPAGAGWSGCPAGPQCWKRTGWPWPGYFWEIINKISAESEEVCCYLLCSYFPFYLASMLIHISCNFWMFCFKSFSRVITWTLNIYFVVNDTQKYFCAVVFSRYFSIPCISQKKLITFLFSSSCNIFLALFISLLTCCI